MPVGRSGHIVVEFDPELKRQLHARLRSEGRDFKGWLLERVHEYLEGPRPSGATPQRSSDGRKRHHPDDVAEATGLSVRETQVALVQLELQGLIVEQLGFYRRAQPC